jgi:uncharacterized protein YkwD
VFFALDKAPPCPVVTRAWFRTWRCGGPSVAALVGMTLAGLAASRAHAEVPLRASVAAQACAYANTAVAAASAQEMRTAVVCLIDVERRAHHLPALQQNARLNRAAQAWTNSMVAHHAFTHGSQLGSRINAVGFAFSVAGENIATGFPAPSAVVNAWMASTGHCRNILNPSYEDVGTGVSRHSIGGSSRGGATWTQDLGLPVGHRAPSDNWAPANGCPY